MNPLPRERSDLQDPGQMSPEPGKFAEGGIGTRERQHELVVVFKGG
jgi:hypothetical protein